MLDLLLMLPAEGRPAQVSILALANNISPSSRRRLRPEQRPTIWYGGLRYLVAATAARHPGPEGLSAEDMASARRCASSASKPFATWPEKLLRAAAHRDVFRRGSRSRSPTAQEWSATIYTIAAYAQQRQAGAPHVRFASAVCIAGRSETLERLIGRSTGGPDRRLSAQICIEPSLAATVFAEFASALELVREGYADIHAAGVCADYAASGNAAGGQARPPPGNRGLAHVRRLGTGSPTGATRGKRRPQQWAWPRCM